MKKLLLFLAACALLFGAASAGAENVHQYTIVPEKSYAPSCLLEGLAYYECPGCGDHYTVTIPAAGHVQVVINGVEPSCTETGLTDGYYCSICNEILTAQEVIPALGHVPLIDNAIMPTCTETGLTEGTHCSRCNETLLLQDTIPALGHDPVVDLAVEPTCTKDGLTEGSHCSRCDEVLIAQGKVEKLGHEPIIDTTIEPTCTADGLTEGRHCGRCGIVLMRQETISALGHDFVLDSTAANTHGHVFHCSRCGVMQIEAVDKYLGCWKIVSAIRTVDGRVLTGSALGSMADYSIRIESDGSAWIFDNSGTTKGVWTINNGNLIINETVMEFDELNRMIVLVGGAYQLFYERQAEQQLSNEAKRFVGTWEAGHIYSALDRSVTPHSQIGELADVKVFIESNGDIIVSQTETTSLGSWAYADGVFYLDGEADVFLMSTGGQLLFDLGDNRYLVFLHTDIHSLLYGNNTFLFPAELRAIEEYAFENVNTYTVILPEGCTTIGSRAFARCSELRRVVVPVTLTSIASDALIGCDDVIFVCPVDNAAIIQYAISNGFPYYVP